MFAVIGSWPVEGKLDPEQLTHIAATVSAQPGFVSGFWGQDPDDAAVAHAVVVLADEESARAMEGGVRSAIPGASLRVIKILAEATIT